MCRDAQEVLASKSLGLVLKSKGHLSMRLYLPNKGSWGVRTFLGETVPQSPKSWARICRN